jgi:ribosomal-protein-alanine N-acetyltransferase
MATSARASAASDLEWRAMRDVDVADVVALEAQRHAAPWTAGNFRGALAAGNTALVCVRGGRIVAYGVLMHAPGEAQILNVTVAADVRGRGLGRELVRRFVRAAECDGAQQVFLEVRCSNDAAIGLYRSEGFVPVARRAGYYPAATPDAPREDALVMRYAIGPASAVPDR